MTTPLPVSAGALARLLARYRELREGGLRLRDEASLAAEARAAMDAEWAAMGEVERGVASWALTLLDAPVPCAHEFVPEGRPGERVCRRCRMLVGLAPPASPEGRAGVVWAALECERRAAEFRVSRPRPGKVTPGEVTAMALALEIAACVLHAAAAGGGARP